MAYLIYAVIKYILRSFAAVQYILATKALPGRATFWHGEECLQAIKSASLWLLSWAATSSNNV